MAKALTVDTVQLAKFLDLTPQRVRQLTAEGVLFRAREIDGKELRGRYDLLDNNVRYIRFLRQQNKLDDTGESEMRMLKRRRLAAEAEMAQLRWKQMRGNLHSAADVEFVMTQMITNFRQHVLAIPSRVARLCVGKKFREILTILMTEIHGVLRTLSGYDAKSFTHARDEYLRSQGIDEAGLNGDGNKTDSEGD
jgi:phage terminase Nu1 subunit (DNA packaging protein)